MALLDSHLEQIAASATAIGELEFAPPKMFTNAVLGTHEITALIRDTEPHERSLFSLDPSVCRLQPRRGAPPHPPPAPVPPAQQSAVARVLGPALLSDIRRSTRGRGVNVPVLLDGAEKLCQAYAVAGVPNRIRAIRERHQRLAASVQEHEEKVLQQQAKLNCLHTGNTDTAAHQHAAAAQPQDIAALEAEVAELEARKRLLEERVAGMDKDLGGLLQV